MKTIILNIVAVVALIFGGSAWASGMSALSTEMPALAKKHECHVCHDIDKRGVGPSWMEISRKYKRVAKYAYGGKEYSLEDGLVMKVSRGGSGTWGAMPMPANDPNGVKQVEIRQLVKFVLGLAK